MSAESITSQLSAADSPWLSVVIPIYNAKRFLKKCIRSILTQSFRDYELLLIDDGSTDGSETICRRFAEEDPRVRYYRKENGGCFQSRLYGIERARGEYILNCDADDYYLTSDAFQILRDRTLQYPCKAYQFGCTHVYNHLKGITRPIPPEPLRCDGAEFSTRDYPILLCSVWKDSRLYLNIWSKLFHRSLLKKLPDADAAIRVFNGEDIILNLHLLENVDAFVFLPDVLYAYRQMGASKRPREGELLDSSLLKEYQFRFFSRWKPHEREAEVLEHLYSSIASRIYLFTVNGLGRFREDKLAALLLQAVEYPVYRQARQYYLEHDEYQSWLIDLLRGADPGAYISAAQKDRKKHRVKRTAKRIIKRIYAAI